MHLRAPDVVDLPEYMWVDVAAGIERIAADSDYLPMKLMDSTVINDHRTPTGGELRVYRDGRVEADDWDCVVRDGKVVRLVRKIPLESTGRHSDVMRMMIEFHRAFELVMNREPKPVNAVDDAVMIGRIALQIEETQELTTAIHFARHHHGPAYGLADVADGLADIVYVAYGTALTLGIDLDAVLREVHRSNMTKLDEDGGPIKREDGKVLKSHRYVPPDVKRVLLTQDPLW